MALSEREQAMVDGIGKVFAVLPPEGQEPGEEAFEAALKVSWVALRRELLAREAEVERLQRVEASLPRPVVMRFAEAMEARLKANDHKGGWQDCRFGWLLGRLRDECEELDQAAHGNYAVLREAADVANFAMMVADVLGALNPTEESTNGTE